MDQWKFDLLDFDLKHPVFPQNAAEFMVKVTDTKPQDSGDVVPFFDTLYGNRLGFLVTLNMSIFTRIFSIC